LFEGTLILTKSNIFTDPNVKAKAYQQLIKLAREELEFDGKIHYLGKTKKDNGAVPVSLPTYHNVFLVIFH
jgi:hypothetical protein